MSAPLALLHGWGLNSRVWDALRAVLDSRSDAKAGAKSGASDATATLALDLPGHGTAPWSAHLASFAAQAEWVAEQLPARCVLLGWSLGGQIALRLAALYPQRVDRLILVAATPRFTASADWPHGLPVATLEQFAASLARDPRQTVTDFLELQVRGSADSHFVLTELRHAVFDHGLARPEALAAGLEILRTNDLRPELPRVRQKSLVIAGRYDRLTPPAASRELARLLPDARLHEFRRAGHAPFLSHAAAFVERLQAFLRDE